MIGARMIVPTIPVSDLDKARVFYGETLGLELLWENPASIRFRAGPSSEVSTFKRPGLTTEHTLAHFEVDDIEATVAELRRRGVVFEEYDLPGLTTVDGIAEVAGNYPSKGGVGERAAWFRDSEGNLLGIGQPIR